MNIDVECLYLPMRIYYIRVHIIIHIYVNIICVIMYERMCGDGRR